jgi:hypothetical protein
MRNGDSFANIEVYMKPMLKRIALLPLLALVLASAGAASAQTLPPDQASENAQTQQQLNSQIQQTQLNNFQTQQSLQQNQMRQQQLFNTMPQPGYQQNPYAPPPVTAP